MSLGHRSLFSEHAGYEPFTSLEQRAFGLQAELDSFHIELMQAMMDATLLRVGQSDRVKFGASVHRLSLENIRDRLTQILEETKQAQKNPHIMQVIDRAGMQLVRTNNLIERFQSLQSLQ
jgi:hypothetical protein